MVSLEKFPDPRGSIKGKQHYYNTYFFPGYFGDFHPAEVFLGQFKSLKKESRCISVQEKEVIEEALGAREKLSKEGKDEGRYMLLLTKNNAALRILQMRLGSDEREIIFGSSFPKDQEYSQVLISLNIDEFFHIISYL